MNGGLVISVTSAGQIAPIERLPCFVLIDRALRDEAPRNSIRC